MVVAGKRGAALKTIISLAAASAVLGLATAAPAWAAGDYVAIVQTTAVNAPADVAWAKVKPYCDIGKWLKAPCEIISGKDGEVGAVRKIAGRIEEVIVATTPTSYTYADIDPKILYHGSVAVQPVSAAEIVKVKNAAVRVFLVTFISFMLKYQPNCSAPCFPGIRPDLMLSSRNRMR